MFTLGSRLKDERKRLGMNQTEFVELIGVSRGSQVAYEADKKIPGGAYLASIEKVGIDVLYVLTGKRIPKPNGLTTESPEETALLENYRAMDEAARLNMQAVSAAFAQVNLNKDTLKDGTDE
ncbi:XRE family transcriptional regulator [Salmonella enterica]|uniref:Transcriptional regulator n=3 Tax=Salmonella enterica I TaxID=59201 RepID=A0A636GD58_SALET|nr:helix-turn-helix transcriptional regulator [Salmonella enterica]EBR8261318.1 XRE family transcriptional regulator [Salmonella enterica subsp. enterica serovar Cerro]EBR9320690.1 XRE family transcriptional regulator [Salmonella enterica subsp. enterica serovar Panama]EBW6040750.1 XRE family transcriptional regulator [Salmonella enterica subsp. enterica serovar Oranienburg]EBW7445747.1 XRE family transcriptional regulator [Salmonella enterica subsp. enterica serovar Muenchen]EBZ2013313.1 XRE 